jgi:hypothetical protein
MALGIMCVCYVSWLYQDCNIASAICVAPPEDQQVMFETCRGP